MFPIKAIFCPCAKPLVDEQQKGQRGRGIWSRDFIQAFRWPFDVCAVITRSYVGRKDNLILCNSILFSNYDTKLQDVCANHLVYIFDAYGGIIKIIEEGVYCLYSR